MTGKAWRDIWGAQGNLEVADGADGPAQNAERCILVHMYEECGVGWFERAV